VLHIKYPSHDLGLHRLGLLASGQRLGTFYAMAEVSPGVADVGERARTVADTPVPEELAAMVPTDPAVRRRVFSSLLRALTVEVQS
jgi:hypothetical protein